MLEDAIPKIPFDEETIGEMPDIVNQRMGLVEKFKKEGQNLLAALKLFSSPTTAS